MTYFSPELKWSQWVILERGGSTIKFPYPLSQLLTIVQDFIACIDVSSVGTLIVVSDRDNSD